MACVRHEPMDRGPLRPRRSVVFPSRLALVLLLGVGVLLPVRSAGQEDSDRVRIHVVRRGEHLTGIAERYGVTVADLREWNRIRGSRILVGQELRIPAELEVYRVRKGDTLAGIARRLDVPLSLLRQLNDLDGDRIYPGQKLKLQPSHRDEAIHVVLRGETLSEIARDHETTVSELRAINGIEGSRIYVGQKLRLRDTETGTHVVERGDALWEIARAYGMKVSELKALNGLTGNRIYPGQVLRVRGGGTQPRTSTYVVQRGDTLGEIAQLHQMSLRELRTLNEIRGSTIHPGQKLLVRPILGDETGLGLLSPDEIPWDSLVPKVQVGPVIAATNGPYYFSRPRAAAQLSPSHNEGAPNGPWATYQQARRLFDAFERRVDEIGRLSRRLEGWTIVLDPGHGGADPGTIVETKDGSGRKIYVVEDEYVYDIALRMYVLLRLHGAEVELTILSPNHLLRGNQPASATFVHERNEVFNSAAINRRNSSSAWPKGQYLSRRRDIAETAFAKTKKGRRVFVSLHADNSPKSPEAVTVFHFERRGQLDRTSRRFAQALLPALGAGSRVRGRNLGVLRGNPADVAVLVEVRNLAYPDEAWALRYEKLRHRDAEKLVKGILEWAASHSG